ncbi:MAG TPA: hypothetical protein VGG02_12330 [Chthoniobacterales bacterium]|jgi:hypothetical protein
MDDLATDTIESRIVFSTEKHPFSVRDLIDAAQFRGEVEPLWRDFLRLVAAEDKANEAGSEVDDDAIDSAAEQFRYQHDLITAEETERWLDERGLTLGDFTSYFVRQFWGAQAADAPAEEQEYLSAPNESRALFTIELVLSGELDRMAQRASWRVASRLGEGGQQVDPSLIAEEENNFRERHGLAEDGVADWLGKLGRDADWLGEQLAMEAVFRRDCAALLTRDARSREISALRLPLTNFEVETIEFDSLDASREALLCVREDGMSMEEVASEGRYPYRRTEILLEDVPEDLQQKFLSVTPGAVLEPIVEGEAFHLCRILGKAEPDVDDPTVKERAEDRILDRYFAELTARHIQWKNILP